MDMYICFCAYNETDTATEFYFIPSWDYNDRSYNMLRSWSAAGEQQLEWEDELERSEVSDYHHHSTGEPIIRLSPRARCFISPTRNHGFAVVDSVLYGTGSHIFSEEFVSNYVADVAKFKGYCFHDVFGLDPILDSSPVIECLDRGRHLYSCFIKRSPSVSPAIWETCPPMEGCRPWSSYPIVVDGKIHVVGGNFGIAEPIHEAFDPVCRRWRTLASPPAPWHEDTGNVAFLSAVVANPTRLIVGSTMAKNFYIYHVREDSWAVLSIPECKNRQFISGPAAVVGETMYWLDYQKYKLYAFDLIEHKWLRGRIRGLDDPKHFGSTSDCPVLLYAEGDMFFVLWTSVGNDAPVVVPRHDIDSDSEDSDYHNNNNLASSSSSINEDTGSLIHCAKVRITKVVPYVKGKHGLCAFILSCQGYVVDHNVSLSGAFIKMEKPRIW